MLINKTLHIETSESQYRVELNVDVNITPPDYSNDASDWDYLGMTELVGFEIISVQIRTCVQKSCVPRQKKDWLSYNCRTIPKGSGSWTEVQMVDLSSEEQEELNEQINKELANECNC